METNITADVSKLTDNKHKKPNGEFYAAYLGVEKEKGHKVLEVQVKYTNNTCHAYVWLKNGDNFFRGYGKAGGYGYCRTSTAVSEAFKNMGIELLKNGDQYDFDGRGVHNIDEIVYAICKASGFEVFPVAVQSYD